MPKKILNTATSATFFLITTLLLFTAGNATAQSVGTSGCVANCGGGGSSSGSSSSGGSSWGNNNYDYQSAADRRFQAQQEAEWERQLDLADEACDLGNEQYNKKNWDRAITYYEEAIRYSPNDKVFQGNLRKARIQKINTAGVKYYMDGDYGNAVALFKQAIAQWSDNTDFNNNLLQAEASFGAQQNQNFIDTEATGRINNILDNASRKMNNSSGGLDFMKNDSSGGLDFMMMDSSVVDLRDAKTLTVDPDKVSGQSVTDTADVLVVSDEEKSELRDARNRADVTPPPRGEPQTPPGTPKVEEGKIAVEKPSQENALLNAYKDKEKGPGTKASLYYSMAQLLVVQGDHDGAVNFLKKALEQTPDDVAIKKMLSYELNASNEKKGENIYNPKVEIMLNALDGGKTWNDSIGILEDKLKEEDSEEKKKFIREALQEVKNAMDEDLRQQKDEQSDVMTDEERREINEKTQEHSYDQK